MPNRYTFSSEDVTSRPDLSRDVMELSTKEEMEEIHAARCCHTMCHLCAYERGLADGRMDVMTWAP